MTPFIDNYVSGIRQNSDEYLECTRNGLRESLTVARLIHDKERTMCFTLLIAIINVELAWRNETGNHIPTPDGVHYMGDFIWYGDMAYQNIKKESE